MTEAEAHLWLKIFRFLYREKKPTRADKKRLGLKWCANAPYGSVWHRGKLVHNPHKRELMGRIVDLREKGLSWYKIAARLLREGEDLSPSTVRRMYQAEMKLRSGETEKG